MITAPSYMMFTILVNEGLYSLRKINWGGNNGSQQTDGLCKGSSTLAH